MRLKTLRSELCKQQQDVAQSIGITKQAYSHYETGRRQADYDTLIKLADYFNVSLDYLLSRDFEQKKEAPAQTQELTDEQKEMLRLFDQCDAGERGRILGYAQNMIERKNSLDFGIKHA